MKSIWSEQTLKPNEVVLVHDGKLTDELYASIDKWNKELGNLFKHVIIEKNVGLGHALNIGLENCNYEMVARMDPDDISLPYRFERQIEVFKQCDVDICGSWIGEFDKDENNIVSYRKTPQTHEKIVSFAKKRNPINHPSVMYKKSMVNNSGGYNKMAGFQDYYLWCRMILEGAKFYNIPEPLVRMRAGYSQIERRSGMKYAVEEINFQRELYRLGFLNIFEFAANVLIRFASRVFPKKIIKQIYKRLRE